MCVNDLIVQGAEPLFFLDYYATGRLDVDQAATVIAGIADACRASGCALIGGETAEMPGMYAGDDFDLAGFAVGIVERTGLIDGAGIVAGDVILGLASSGPHSNGYSLIRRIVADLGLDYGAPAPFDPARSLGGALLAPTRLYVRDARAAIAVGGVKGIVHITGGGFPENIPRSLPPEAAAEIECTSWAMPPVFGWLAAAGNVPPEEMVRAFNCGIGLVMIVDPARLDAVEAALTGGGVGHARIGRIVPRAGGEAVRLRGLGEAFA